MNDQVKNLPIATLAGGCFWCVESDFRKLPGVVKVVSGYAGGHGPNPTYEDYAAKGYVEAVQISYDPKIVTYGQLLDYFWRHIDPTDAGGQFVDRGPQYRSRHLLPRRGAKAPGGGIETGTGPVGNF